MKIDYYFSSILDMMNVSNRNKSKVAMTTSRSRKSLNNLQDCDTPSPAKRRPGRPKKVQTVKEEFSADDED